MAYTQTVCGCTAAEYKKNREPLNKGHSSYPVQMPQLLGERVSPRSLPATSPSSPSSDGGGEGTFLSTCGDSFTAWTSRVSAHGTGTSVSPHERVVHTLPPRARIEHCPDLASMRSFVGSQHARSIGGIPVSSPSQHGTSAMASSRSSSSTIARRTWSVSTWSSASRASACYGVIAIADQQTAVEGKQSPIPQAEAHT